MIWTESEKNRLIVESSRVGLLFLILIFSVASYIAQSSFLDWSFLTSLYLVLTLGMSLHLGMLIKLNWFYKHPGVLLLTFALDLILVSVFIFQSGLNQTFFLFANMTLIALGGFVFRTEGALILALAASVLFSWASLWAPELKNLQHILLLAINNVAFFVIAGLTGYLSEQLFQTDKELKKTGLDLKALEKLNSILIENIPSGILSFDASGTVLQANPSASHILSRDSLRGINIESLFPGLFHQSGTDKNFDFIYQDSQNNKKILGVKRNRFFNSTQNEENELLLFDDLTSLREYELKARQNEKLAAIGQLAAGIAHEIRNPLAGISGSIELLSQTSKDEEDRKLMKIILREIDRLNHLITEFLEYSRPEKVPTEKISLSQILGEVLEAVKTNKNLRLDVEQIKNFEETPLVVGHRDKIKQVFLNIVINAYQAMTESGKAQIIVQARFLSEKNQVQISIRDTGAGMSESTLKRLYEPFHTTKPKGTGLGLALTHKILEVHRAQVSVTSVLGQGTEFVLVFPCASQSETSQ